MELLRHVIVLFHIVGFAVTFGAWVAEAAAGRFRPTRIMDYGLLVSLVSGLALAAPWPAGVVLNYPKIGLKLAILVALGGLLGVGSARQKRTEVSRGAPAVPLRLAHFRWPPQGGGPLVGTGSGLSGRAIRRFGDEAG